jgi:hypothetical protein
MTLLELQTAVRQRADMENSQFISDAELASYINQSYFELYDLLVQKYGDNYFVALPYQVTTDGANAQYSLPSDFYKLLGVDLALSAPADPNSFIALKPFDFTERNRASRGAAGNYGYLDLRYRINGSKIWLTPLPSGNQVLQIWYVPRLTTLSAPSDTADGVSGWLEYVICDAAIKCLQKEESDVSVLMNQKMNLIARIQSAAENRDAGSPATVADSRSGDWGCGSDDGFHF